MITVTVTNNGPTGGVNVNSFSQTFTVTVTPVNQPPTIDNIPNQTAILENDTIPQEVDLTGIGPGLGDTGQLLNVFATSSNAALIANPAVTYPTGSTGGVSTGELFYTAAPNMSGTATITVVVTDNGGTANGGVNHDHHHLHGDGRSDRCAADAQLHPQPQPDRGQCRVSRRST